MLKGICHYTGRISSCILDNPLKLSRNVIASSRKSKTVGGGLKPFPTMTDFLAILYFKSQTQNLDRLCERNNTRTNKNPLSSLMLVSASLIPMLYWSSHLGFHSLQLVTRGGTFKRPTIRKLKIKLSIPPKLVLCNTYKQATQLTLTEGLVDL